LLFEAAAAAGVDESLNQVGRIYELGLGAPRDNSRAIFYYQKAIEAGNAAANYRLGSMYVNGLGLPKDGRKACELFHTGAIRGNPDASKSYSRFCGR
jgi:TPR repeat protein